jgi:GAF domain-containing protein
VQTDPRFTEVERIRMQNRQIAAFIGVTLLKGGQVVAAFGVNHAMARIWSPTEVELVRDVAERTWDAVERTRAETALREREHRLRLALDASGGGSWTWEASTNRVDWDDGFRVRYGFAPEETPTFEAWVSRVHEEDRPRLLSFLNQGGLEIALFLFVTAFFVNRTRSRLAQVAEVISIAIMAIMTGVSHWIISARMLALRASMGTIDQVSPNDARRIEFDSLHRYSVRVMAVALVAGLIAFFLASRNQPERSRTWY